MPAGGGAGQQLDHGPRRDLHHLPPVDPGELLILGPPDQDAPPAGGLDEEEHLIGEYIIGNISPEGYLSISVPEMAKELELSSEQIDAILKLIHRFDPIGVGSRDLKESLLIQLREKGKENRAGILAEHMNRNKTPLPKIGNGVGPIALF